MKLFNNLLITLIIISNSILAQTKTKQSNNKTISEPKQFICGKNFTDNRDKKMYPTIVIGNQCWMAKNMDIGKFTESIPDYPVHSNVSNNGIIEKYCFNNKEENCKTYGGWYDWDEMMQYNYVEGSQGICPDGWHIPTYNEAFEMLNFLKAFEGGGDDMKVGGKSGFNALMAGLRLSHGQFNHFNSAATFWISKSRNRNSAWFFYMDPHDANMYYGSLNRTDGYSVRCIKNVAECSELPTIAFAGADQLYTDTIYAILNANTPESGKGKWYVSEGDSGRFENDTLPNSKFYGKPGKLYKLKWLITAKCGTSEDFVTVRIFPKRNMRCPKFVIDGENNEYPVVKVETQCWMAANIDIGTYVEAKKTNEFHTEMKNNNIIEKFCYMNDKENCRNYGALYTWDEAMQYSNVPGSQGICPHNWHIPTLADWEVLMNSVGGDTLAGDNLMKEGGTVRFNGVMSGYRIGFGIFVHMNNRLGFITSNEFNKVSSWNEYKIFNDSNFYIGAFNKLDAYAVRCVRND